MSWLDSHLRGNDRGRGEPVFFCLNLSSNLIPPFLDDDDEAAKFERFMQERKAPTAKPTSKEPDRFRTSPDSPESKSDFNKLLKKLETDKTVSSDPDWAKFQTFLGKQAQKFPPNDSGKGSESILPAELRGLNWGACILNVIWGAKMKIPGGTILAWLILLMIPIIGWIFPFYLLFKGNELAWQYRKWESLDEYRESQKNWAIASLIIIVILGISLLVLGAWLSSMINSILHA